jgi:hypothetical protein
MTNMKSQVVREIVGLCRNDSRIVGVIHYGSDAKGMADQWSDLDLLFFVDDAECEGFLVSQDEWLLRLSNIIHVYAPNGCPRIFLNDSPAPLRIDTAFWPASRIKEISKFPWKPASVESMLIYEAPDSEAIRTEITELIHTYCPSAFSVKEAFAQIEGDFWYYLLRVYGLIKRGDLALALTEYHWFVLDYLGWLIHLQSGITENWRRGLSTNRLSRRIDKRFVQRLQECIPCEKGLNNACINAIFLGRELLNACSEEHNLKAATELADKVESLFLQEPLPNNELYRTPAIGTGEPSHSATNEARTSMKGEL